MMRIVIANLPWRRFGRTGVRAGSRWPHLKGRTEKDYLPFPFFLAYAASLLKKNDFEVTLIDAIAEGMPYGRFLRAIENIEADLLVCETSTVTLEHDLRLLEKINNNVSVALCGPDVNIRKPSFLENHKYINFVLFGEYEFTLLELVSRLAEGKDLNNVLGLICRDSNGVKANPPRPLADLDKLPWPLRQGLLMGKYNDTPGDMPLPSVQILASRGCPYKCKFCLWPQVMYQSNRYRARNILDVVDEMEYLAKEMSFKSIYFDDDTFNFGKERMLKLCDEIKRRNLSIPWAIMARADLMDEEILERMRDAGLFAVKYGVESATQELLDNINKNMDFEKTKRMVKFTKLLGIKTHLTFTFGLPGETAQTIRKTIDCALELDPTTIQFSIATPFPGTSFYKEMKESGHIVSENWIEYDGNNNSVINYHDVTKRDLERAIKSAYKQWADHCAKRRAPRKSGYMQLLAKSLTKYGLLMTSFKVIRYILRNSLLFIMEKVFYKKEIERKIKKNGLRIGRLTLLFSAHGLDLYWDNMKLTRAAGFMSSIVPKSQAAECVAGALWNCEKINDNEFMLRRKLESLSSDEIWKVKVIDEKQIDWEAVINVRNELDISRSRMSVILSEKYRKWVDAWGEGVFSPVSDYSEAELRNPKSSFIGVRGRKKIKGQLPTVLLDLTKNNSDYLPCVRNASFVLGARILEAKATSLNGDGKLGPGGHTIFSGRIKIVEEDFRKKALNKLR